MNGLLLVSRLFFYETVMKTKLIKFHFIILLILVINFFISLLLDFELNNYTKIGLKILLYGSALIGFFVFLKPFKSIAVYCSLYVICSLYFLLSYLIKGGFVEVISSIFGLLLFTSPPLYEANNYEIQPYYAIMGSCCQYKVYENYSPFIRYRGNFTYTEIIDKHKEPVNFSDSTIGTIKNIEIEKDNVFIEFKNKSTRRFKLY